MRMLFLLVLICYVLGMCACAPKNGPSSESFDFFANQLRQQRKIRNFALETVKRLNRLNEEAMHVDSFYFTPQGKGLAFFDGHLTNQPPGNFLYVMGATHTDHDGLVLEFNQKLALASQCTDPLNAFTVRNAQGKRLDHRKIFETKQALTSISQPTGTTLVIPVKMKSGTPGEKPDLRGLQIAANPDCFSVTVKHESILTWVPLLAPE